jgi:TetR/AcrR family transcriptional repressor of mexJK operon
MDTTTKSGSELLLESAQRLFLSQGYANVSMQAIAADAGMTKGAPYYHFESKEELFYQVSLRIFERLRNELIASLDADGPLEERIARALEDLIANMSSDFSSWVNDLKRALQPERKQCLVDTIGGGGDMASLVQPSFERAAERGELTRVPPDVAARVFFRLAMACIDEASYLQVAGLYTREWQERTAAETATVFMSGVA